VYYSFQLYCFFFQAEDGIRDFHVTGVQTCALPISESATSSSARPRQFVVHLRHAVEPDLDPGRVTPELRRVVEPAPSPGHLAVEIGRASCRERVQIPVVAV